MGQDRWRRRVPDPGRGSRPAAARPRARTPTTGWSRPRGLRAARLARARSHPSGGGGGRTGVQRRRPIRSAPSFGQAAPLPGDSVEHADPDAGLGVRGSGRRTIPAPAWRKASPDRPAPTRSRSPRDGALGCQDPGSVAHGSLARRQLRRSARPGGTGVTPLHAHLLCVALVAVDLLARAWRIQWIVQGLGHRMTVKDAFVLNAFGDAACALTPLRIGGEPARLAGMLRTRVPATAAFVGISLEVLAAWPVIILAAGWMDLAVRSGLVAQRRASPRCGAAERAWPWIALVALASVITWIYARRVTSPFARQLRRPVRRALVYWRRMPTWPLLASIPMTLLNLGTRVAILPGPRPHRWRAHRTSAPCVLGSFALLYSQLVLPTPSGAGAVELGFLGGSGGRPGSRTRAGSCWPGGSTPTGLACCWECGWRRRSMAGPRCGSWCAGRAEITERADA